MESGSYGPIWNRVCCSQGLHRFAASSFFIGCKGVRQHNGDILLPPITEQGQLTIMPAVHQIVQSMIPRVKLRALDHEYVDLDDVQIIQVYLQVWEWVSRGSQHERKAASGLALLMFLFRVVEALINNLLNPPFL